MEFIYTLTFVTFLTYSAAAMSLHINNNKQNYFDARNSCTLARPSLLYSPEGYRIEFNLDDRLTINQRAWVGYIQDMEVFRYLGCVLEGSANFRSEGSIAIQTDIGQCKSYCRMYEYFGVNILDGKVTCHCISSVDLNALTSCGPGTQTEEFAYGIQSTISVYKLAPEDIDSVLKVTNSWIGKNDNCLCLFDPLQNAFKWSQCSFSYNFICSLDSSGTTVFPSAVYQRWSEATEGCLRNQFYPSANFSNINLDSTIANQMWTSYVRSYVISNGAGGHIAHRRYGYIERIRDNLYELKFETAEKKYIHLCLTNEESTTSTLDPTKTEDKYTQTTIIQDNWTTRVSNTSSSPKSDIADGNKQQMDDGSSLIGIYVGVPTGILLVVAVIITGIIVWRTRRRKTPPKDANTSLEIHSYDSPTTDEQRPDSLDVYNQINEVAYEDYDLIEGQEESNTTENNCIGHSYFILEKTPTGEFKSARSDNYDYVKGPEIDDKGANDQTYSVPQKENRVNNQKVITEGHDYAKVVRDGGIQTTSYRNHTDNEGKHTKNNTEYDHLDQDSLKNPTHKVRYQDRNTNSGICNIYNRTGVNDTGDTYDHISSEISSSQKERNKNAKSHGDNLNTYDKLSGVSLSNDNSTYNHLTREKHNSFDEQSYNSVNIRNEKQPKTDNPYDHNS